MRAARTRQRVSRRKRRREYSTCMWVRLRKVSIALLSIAVVLAVVAASAFSSGGPLTGTWSGYINRAAGGATQRHHLRLVVNASERGGSWRVSASCSGTLRLQSISNGFHHYVEKLARGSTCLGGGVDCLERAGAGLYDEFQPQPGTNYTSATTLTRVKG